MNNNLNCTASVTALMEAVCKWTDKLDEMYFIPFYCVLLEEWCVKHDMDVNEMIEKVEMYIRDVNEEEGTFEGM